MNAKERRQAILEQLKRAEKPVSATALARQYGVSRQIIVGDVALLRAGGEPISATPRGYVLDREGDGLLHTVAVRHQDNGQNGMGGQPHIVDQGFAGGAKGLGNPPGGAVQKFKRFIPCHISIPPFRHR